MADESGASPSPSRDSNWLVECIKFAYKKHDLPVPDGVKGHQMHKMALFVYILLILNCTG